MGRGDLLPAVDSARKTSSTLVVGRQDRGTFETMASQGTKGKE